MRVLAVSLVAIAACRGGSAPPAPATAARPLPSIDAPPAGPDDVIVARVDGRPVWGSCVAAQAAGLHEAKQAALDDCIGFEVLAGAAAAHGEAARPGVRDAFRRELVSRFVDVAFLATHETVADLPADLRAHLLDKFAWRMHRPEYRFAVYVRAPVPAEKAPPGADEAAHRLIDEIYQRVKDRDDLFPSDLYRIAGEVAGDRTIQDAPEPYGTGIDGPGDPTFAHPLFAIPAIGMVAPPARTRWGWDLILWTDTMPPLESTEAQVLAQLFPEIRHRMFIDWTSQILRDQHVEVSIDPAALTSLVADEDRPKAKAAAGGAAATAPGAPVGPRGGAPAAPRGGGP